MNNEKDYGAIHIVMSSSEEYAQYCNTCMASILYNIKNSYNVNFYILTLGLSEKSKDKINKIKKIKNCNIEYIDIDGATLSIFNDIVIPEHISMATYSRLFLPNILKNIKKVLYIDCDTIVTTNIVDIYNQNIDDYSLAMVRDVVHEIHAKRLWQNTHDVYYNAGVMIINLEKLRRSNYFEKIKKNIQTRKHLYIYADQDLLNDTFRGDIKELDKYDNFHGFEYHYGINAIPQDNNELKKFKSKIHIAHFTGASKPWFSNKHIFRKEFLFYWKMTAFYSPFLCQNFYTENIKYKIISVFGHILFYKKKSENKKTYYMLGIKIHRKRKHINSQIIGVSPEIDQQKESKILFDQYLKSTKIKKLQICSAENYLDGWLNTDLFYNKEKQIGHLNVLEKFPFEDNTFDYVYSEHGVEHFEVPDFYTMLLEVYRCMIPGGWFRIITPDLQKLIKFYQEDSEINNQYMTLQANAYEPFLVSRDIYNKCFVLNDFFKLWGHKNIYDEAALMEMCRLAGFRNIRHSELQHSEISHFRGIARHIVFHDFDVNTFESMVIECQK